MKMDISPYLNRLEMLQQTADQLIKDFGMFGLEIKFSGNNYNAYEELFNQVEPHIDQMLTNNRQKFMAVLYRIDLSDTQIQQATKENPTDLYSHLITDLILKRELQKVVIRNYYKNQ